LLLEIDPAPYQFTVSQVEAQLVASKANIKQAEASLTTANAGVPNAQAYLAKAMAADDLAKTQEQIALNIQRADKAAISLLNVAKATQERQEEDAAVQQAEAGNKSAKIVNIGVASQVLIFSWLAHLIRKSIRATCSSPFLRDFGEHSEISEGFK
jgi:multidrug resistance efflux pump